MTKAIVTMMLAAVAMQAETMLTKIEFPFVVSGVSRPAGSYQLLPMANYTYSIRHQEMGKQVVLMGFEVAADRSRTKPESHLGFACAAGKWSMTQVWAGGRGLENQKVRRELESGVEAVHVATAGFGQVAAKVPIAFEAGGVKMPEGEYRLRAISGTNDASWVLRNQATLQPVIVIRQAQGDARKGAPGAVRFRCTELGE